MDSIQLPLKVGYGLVPIIAGADKFTNLLCDWDKYLSPAVERMLPMSGRSFMKLVGVIEIGAGLLVLRSARVGGMVVGGWLAGIVANLLTHRKYYDVAARDALLAVGAFTLARLEGRTVPALREPRAQKAAHFAAQTAAPQTAPAPLH